MANVDYTVDLENALAEKNLIKIHSLWVLIKSTTELKSLDYIKFAEIFIQFNEAAVAFDICNEGLKNNEGNIHLEIIMIKSLLRIGAVDRIKNSQLQNLYNKAINTVQKYEVITLLAEVYITHAKQLSEDNGLRKKLFEKAYENYKTVYDQHNDIYCGINAAIIANEIFPGKEIVIVIANKIINECTQNKNAHENSFKYYSCLGLAYLLKFSYKEAISNFEEAVNINHDNYYEKNILRKNIDLILKNFNDNSFNDKLKELKNKIESIFKVPSIVVFCGHVVDHNLPPGVRKFPQQISENVKSAIKSRLNKINAGFGYASAAAGADILFGESLMECRENSELSIILPYDETDFIKKRVDIVAGANWKDRYDAIIKKASSVSSLLKVYNNIRVCYEYTSLTLLGLAKMKAKQIGAKVIPLVVWDKNEGTTSKIIKIWKEKGFSESDIEIIDLTEIYKQNISEYEISSDSPSFISGDFDVSNNKIEFPFNIRTMLFADVYHFSHLMETQIPDFVNMFLGAVSEVLNTLENQQKPLFKNTWGDGLFMVFEKIRDAGIFALKLNEKINNIDWKKHGFPDSLRLRIALHAGPVYHVDDPVIETKNFHGTQVNFAARIEPVTEVGEIYASLPFAALTAVENVKEFKCEYIGKFTFPKNFGTYPLYHVTKRRCLK